MASVIVVAAALWVFMWDDDSAATVDVTEEELQPYLLTDERIGDGFTALDNGSPQPQESVELGARSSMECQAAFEVFGAPVVDAYGESVDPVQVVKSFVREDEFLADVLIVGHVVVAIPGATTNFEGAAHAIHRDCMEPYREPIIEIAEGGEPVETGEFYKVTVDAEPIGIGDDAMALTLTMAASSGTGVESYTITTARDDVISHVTVSRTYPQGLKHEDLELAKRLAEEVDDQIDRGGST